MKQKRANQIEHPSVVSYINVLPYDRPEVQVKCVCFVCNYIKGKNLREYMRTISHRYQYTICGNIFANDV